MSLIDRKALARVDIKHNDGKDDDVEIKKKLGINYNFLFVVASCSLFLRSDV